MTGPAPSAAPSAAPPRVATNDERGTRDSPLMYRGTILYYYLSLLYRSLRDMSDNYSHNLLRIRLRDWFVMPSEENHAFFRRSSRGLMNKTSKVHRRSFLESESGLQYIARRHRAAGSPHAMFPPLIFPRALGACARVVSLHDGEPRELVRRRGLSGSGIDPQPHPEAAAQGRGSLARRLGDRERVQGTDRARRDPPGADGSRGSGGGTSLEGVARVIESHERRTRIRLRPRRHRRRVRRPGASEISGAASHLHLSPRFLARASAYSKSLRPGRVL